VLVDVAFTSAKTGRTLHTSLLEARTLHAGRIVENRPFYWDTAVTAAAAAG